MPPAPDVVDLVVETATMMSVLAAERLVRIDAMRRELLAEATGRGGAVRDVIERSIRLELAAATRITEYAAGRLLMHAEALVSRYPSVLDSLWGGRITEKHAEIYVDLVDEVPPELRGQVCDRALVLAETQPVGSFRRALRDLISRVSARTLDQRYQTAITRRRVWVERGADGMDQFGLFHPGVEVQAIDGRITAMAKVIAAADGETRTLDQIRADIVADLLIDGTTAHLPATVSGIKAKVVVTVPVLSLLDSTSDAAPDDVADATDGRVRQEPAGERVLESGALAGVETGGEPASGTPVRKPRNGVSVRDGGDAAGGKPAPDFHSNSPTASLPPRSWGGGEPNGTMVADPPVVEGIGPIPLSVARELCGGASPWMRVLTHPETGMVLSVGRDRYQPPAALRRLVRWRADRCMAPGCSMPASRCEIDNQVRWTDGGETCLDNNVPFCKGHHLVKDNTDWLVRQIADRGGAVEWISPTGRRYVVHPERRVPTFTTGHRHADAPAPF